MSEPNPEAYYNAARQLALSSRYLERDLKDLDSKLEVNNSAGSYFSGGTRWAQNYDQAASDVFEAASTAAIAARELAYQVHQAGLNHANSENSNHPGAPLQPTPAAPQGASMEYDLHPAESSAGGLHDTPAHWDLVVGLVQRPWADSDPDRIAGAGTDFQSWGVSTGESGEMLRSFAVVKWSDDEKLDPEVEGIIDEINAVAWAIQDSGNLATYLNIACARVGTVSKSNRDDITFSLKLLWLIVNSYRADKLAAGRIPFVGGVIERAIDEMIDVTKAAYAGRIDASLKAINDTVDQAIGNCRGINQTATSDARGLSSILDRTPRNTDPIRNRDFDDSQVASVEAEARAGMPARSEQERVLAPDGKFVVPEFIDRDNRQVYEVKNVNTLNSRSIAQIKSETLYAHSEGYSMILVTDHRTQITNPDILNLINTGQVEWVTKELDDNDDH